MLQRVIGALDPGPLIVPLSNSPQLTVKQLSKSDVQNILQVSQRTIDRILRRGELPYFRMGRQVRIKPEDLNSYLSKLTN
jgi:excisionase family DNA binding protein